MSDVTLELTSMEDFDARRSLPVDNSDDAAVVILKTIKPGMALAENGSGFWAKAAADGPFALAYVAGNRLDVIQGGRITTVKPRDLVYLDQANVVTGTPTAGQFLKLDTGNPGKFAVEDPVDTVAKTLLVKARVVKAAGADGRLLVQFEKFT